MRLKNIFFEINIQEHSPVAQGGNLLFDELFALYAFDDINGVTCHKEAYSPG